jgi:hypothetical protein
MLASLLFTLAWIATLSYATGVSTLHTDPCAIIAGKKWVSPKAVRQCFASFKVEEASKANIIEVVNKTLAFHASVNYQIQAPEPFATDVHEDLLGDLARISSQNYTSDFDLHIDLSRTLKRLNDGHCVWINRCYDSLYVTYLPVPLVLLTDSDGYQNVHIAPEAFDVSSTEFGDEIEVWQRALPVILKGQLSSLSGAKVLLIDGEEPFVAVNKNALITGGYQSFGTRQNSFFSSYFVGKDGNWTYAMGNFAQQALPLTDSVSLTLQLPEYSEAITLTLPYRSRFGSASKNFTDSESYRETNCRALNATNGRDVYANDTSALTNSEYSDLPVSLFQQQPPIGTADFRKHYLNVMVDNAPLSDVSLPPILQPTLPPLNESYAVAQFFMLNDNVTGVLALGSFSAKSFNSLQEGLLSGLLALKEKGASQLIVDVTNNGGGYICIAHWLHRILVGPKSSTEPEAGLDTKLRAGHLAQLIVQQVKDGADPDAALLYNPTNWRNATHHSFPEKSDWLKPLVNVKINGRKDTFSQRYPLLLIYGLV